CRVGKSVDTVIGTCGAVGDIDQSARWTCVVGVVVACIFITQASVQRCGRCKLPDSVQIGSKNDGCDVIVIVSAGHPARNRGAALDFAQAAIGIFSVKAKDEFVTTLQ